MSSWNRMDTTQDKMSSPRYLNSRYNNSVPPYTYPTMQPLPRITNEKKNNEYLHRFAGLAVGLASVVSEHVLSHPCIVLRRQCQVHNTTDHYHLTPFTLFRTVYNIQRHQSATTLWKGIGSSLIVKCISVGTEAGIAQISNLPIEITRRSTLKQMAEHILLKSIGIIVVVPFYAASLVETVESEVTSDGRGLFDCLVEGVHRFSSFVGLQPSTRLLPIWKLIAPALAFGLMHYLVAAFATHRVQKAMKEEIRGHKEDSNGSVDLEQVTIYESYYPELVATFSGNLLADTILYPLETVLHRLFLQGTRTIIDNTDTGLEVVPIMTRYEGIFDCYRSILEEESFWGLYKGFGALLLQYALHIAILKMTRVFFLNLSSKPRAVTHDPREARGLADGGHLRGDWQMGDA